MIPKAPAASAIDVMPIILEDWKHLVQRNLIPGPIIQFGGTWRLVRGDLLRMLQGAAVLEIGSNTGRAKSMATGGVGEPGRADKLDQSNIVLQAPGNL